LFHFIHFEIEFSLFFFILFLLLGRLHTGNQSRGHSFEL
jgi:hypothetical protein